MDSIRNGEVVIEDKFRTIEEMIQEAGQNKRVLRIIYTDRKGNGSWRETEPYELKDGKYFAYCLDRESIRAFKLENITSAVITEQTYVPKWPVKF